ncbi:MAG: SPOR domain-containing protein, partial [Bdellovibrionales bacterium]|nr:SPOR domain-containing protein [Bdellovibrionales bacterium]
MRTYPTVYNLATMNKRNLRSFELHLSLLQLAVVLGIVTGSMCVAFYLGFGSGHTSGFQEASVSDLKRAMKLPISDDELEDVVSEEHASAVYAKLGRNELPALNEKAMELPELATIEEAPQKLNSPRDIVVEDKKLTAPLFQEESPVALKSPSLGELKDKQAASMRMKEPDISERPVDKSVSEAVQLLGSGESLGSVAKPKKTLGGLLELQNNDKKAAKKTVVSQEPTKQAVEKKETATKVAALVVPPTPKVETPPQPKPVAPTMVKKQTAPTPPRVQTKVNSGWYAQVAAPQKIADAKSIASQLQGSGFSIAIEEADVRGQVYYRVLVGPEDNRTLASRLVGQLKRESF